MNHEEITEDIAMPPHIWDHAVALLARTLEDQSRQLTEYGHDGWELIAVAGTTAYFKRPCPNQKPPGRALLRQLMQQMTGRMPETESSPETGPVCRGCRIPGHLALDGLCANCVSAGK